MKNNELLVRLSSRFRIWGIVILFIGVLFDTIYFIGITLVFKDSDPNGLSTGVYLLMIFSILFITIIIYLLFSAISLTLKWMAEVGENIQKIANKNDSSSAYFTK